MHSYTSAFYYTAFQQEKQIQQKRIAVYTNDTAILFMVIKGLNSVGVDDYIDPLAKG